MNTIQIIGAGYVGLVTGACFAHRGSRVVVVEHNPARFKVLEEGKVPFYEPGLDVLLEYGISHHTLEFVPSIQQGLAFKPDIIFSCVGTPSMPDGSVDLSAVWQVAQELGTHLTYPALVVNKSTCPVGTAEKMGMMVNAKLAQRGINEKCAVASNPEFLREGSALNDFFSPDRVIVGVQETAARDALYDLYKQFLRSEEQFLVMDIASAELSKYAANGMLATRISFMNQLAQLACAVGADIEQIKRGMGSDPRIGKSFINAGVGYGGSCFPKDVKGLVHMGKEHGQPMTLLEAVDSVNDAQQDAFAQKVKDHYGASLRGKRVGIWGLAFKPNTDDIRCAPSLTVINRLLAAGAHVIAYDPVAMDAAKKILGGAIEYAAHPSHVLSLADCLVLMTEWQEFVQSTPSDFALLRDKTVFDGRNCFDPVEMAHAGINYFSVGRPVLQLDGKQASRASCAQASAL